MCVCVCVCVCVCHTPTGPLASRRVRCLSDRRSMHVVCVRVVSCTLCQSSFINKPHTSHTQCHCGTHTHTHCQWHTHTHTHTQCPHTQCPHTHTHTHTHTARLAVPVPVALPCQTDRCCQQCIASVCVHNTAHGTQAVPHAHSWSAGAPTATGGTLLLHVLLLRVVGRFPGADGAHLHDRLSHGVRIRKRRRTDHDTHHAP